MRCGLDIYDVAETSGMDGSPWCRFDWIIGFNSQKNICWNLDSSSLPTCSRGWFWIYVRTKAERAIDITYERRALDQFWM